MADTNNHAIRVVDLPSGATGTLVLKGIEAFDPPPDDADYKGVIVVVPPLDLAAGTGAIVLDVGLPASYKVNAEAPSSAIVTVEGEAISISDAGSAVDLTGTTFPVRVPIDLFERSADLMVDLTVVYCRDDAQSLCLIEQVRFVTEVTVGNGAGTDIVLSHAVVLPDIGGE